MNQTFRLLANFIIHNKHLRTDKREEMWNTL
jgi:hypothetical protein